MTHLKKTSEKAIKIPAYNSTSDLWTLRSFGTRDEFTQYVDDQFKEPGSYKFDNTPVWNAEGTRFFEEGYYTDAPKGTRDYLKYWEREKLKCRRGVIFDNFYLPRDYYMWVNFLPIYDKKEKTFKLANVWDTQYHMALYELRAELHWKHCPILKKRQIASSYFHMGKVINKYWFEEGSICKVGASRKGYVEDTWKFLNEYRDHLNANTAWYRASEPNKLGSWQQKQRITEDDRDIWIGLKSTIKGTTFEKDAKAGVGGPCDIFFHEEGGIAPKADDTYQFMLPALKSGMTTTGLFIIAGSVGDLDQCDPLKKFVMKPASFDMLAVPYDMNPNSEIKESGLFIPQSWSCDPFIDSYGNSMVQVAKEAILEERKFKEKNLTLQDYQTHISQHPLTIEEAFAYRKASMFPLHLVARAKERIVVKGRNYVCVELEKTEKGIEHKLTTKSPILKWPIDMKEQNKEGVIQVFNNKFPKKDVKWGTYISGVDPVDVGKTESSESLFSIFIYETLIEQSVYDEEGKKDVSLEGDEIVACWTGRFDDVNHTNEQAELLLEWYQAWAVCENNIKSFIQHMIRKKKTKYLATPRDLPFTKEIQTTNTNVHDYGVKMTQNVKNYLLEGVVDYLKEEIGETTISETRSVKKYGVDKIPDIMLLEEIMGWTPEANTDRLIAFGLALAFAKARQANGLFVKHVTYKKPPKKENYNMVKQMFNTIGMNSKKSPFTKPRGGFRNLR